MVFDTLRQEHQHRGSRGAHTNPNHREGEKREHDAESDRAERSDDRHEALAGEERLPLNRAAVGGLVIGAVSWLAMLHPALWVVPAVGVVLAGAAWYAIERSDRRFRGGRLALIGLALVLGFLNI